jgi:hypothetical protein
MIAERSAKGAAEPGPIRMCRPESEWVEEEIGPQFAFWSAAVALLCRFGFAFWFLLFPVYASPGNKDQKMKQKRQSKATAALQQGQKVT